MSVRATVVLETLRCIHEDEDGSEPYIWPALLSVDAGATVRVTAPAVGNARVVIKSNMRAGDTAGIPSSAGSLAVDLEDGTRGLILVTALLEADDGPEHAFRAGFQAFTSELRAAIADNLLGLSTATGDELATIIAVIKKRVSDKVHSAVEDDLTTTEKIRIKANLLNLDDTIDSDFQNFTLPLASRPLTLRIAPDQGGQLLSYGDAGTPGNVSAPVVVGFGGWSDFKFLFAGRNAAAENQDRIYAVDQNGQLLSYGDAGTPGNVSAPVVVGFGGWSAFKFLFAGRNAAGEDRIYAVDQSGQLLSYGDAGTPGNVSSPVVVGFGGWSDFEFLLAGRNAAGENRIYAVDKFVQAPNDFEIQGTLQVQDRPTGSLKVTLGGVPSTLVVFPVRVTGPDFNRFVGNKTLTFLLPGTYTITGTPFQTGKSGTPTCRAHSATVVTQQRTVTAGETASVTVTYTSEPCDA